MMRPPPGGPQDDDEYDSYYSYDSESEDGAGPPPMGGGPRPPMQQGMPPPMGGMAKPPPFAMGAPPPVSRGPMAPSTKMGDDDYDSYYDYEYDDEYEYEYEELYDYEYEYDEEGDSEMEDFGQGMARPKSPMAGGFGIDPSMLAAKRGQLANAPDPEDRPKPKATGGGMFGLTSVNLRDLRGNMNKVEVKEKNGPVAQQDFRGNLRAGAGNRNTNASQANAVVPAWATKKLRPGERPMTTNIQNVDTDAIRQKVLAAKANQKERKQAGPRFLNGVPVNRGTSVRVRQRTSAKFPGGAPTNARVSAKIVVNRTQDANDPNKIITKNRVSYKVKKRVSANMGANGLPGPTGRVSRRVRISAKDPNRISRNPNRVSTRSKRVSKNPNRVSKNPNRVSRNPNRTSQNPNRVSTRSKRVSKNPNRISRNPNRISARNKAKDPNRVSRRHKRPNVNRTSVNNNIFGAKTADTEVQGVGKGDGCYLRHEANDAGTVFAEWNVVGHEGNESLAYFKPGTPVPRFNYRRNDGKVVLMSGVTDSKTKYYEGWTYFFAMAKEYDGALWLQGKIKESGLGVKLVALTKGNIVKSISDEGKAIDMKDWACIAVLPPDCDIFEGASNIDPNFFMNIANQNGMSVKLQ